MAYRVAYRAALAPVCVSLLCWSGCDGSSSRAPDTTPDAAQEAVADGGMHTSPDASLPETPPCAATRLTLADFTLQRAAEVGADGAVLSRAGFDASGWHAARVPSTVLAALVADGTYPDPRVRDNLERIPAEPFAGPWWYRSEFTLDGAFLGPSMRLDLAGVNYRAEVWLNGQKLADPTQVVGTYVAHELDVSTLLVEGKNALAIQVFPADPEAQLAITFHDWNPDAPDHGMGLWREVALERTGQVALHAARVNTVLDEASGSANLTVSVDAINRSGEPVETRVSASLLGHTLTQDVALAAGEARVLRFAAEDYPELLVSKPALWWPAHMGEQALHELCVSAELGQATSDREALRFGIRQVSSDLDGQGHRRFRINGKPLFVRGGGYAMDLLFTPPSASRIDAELGYALDLGLNTIRLEGKLESEAFFARADELGVLTLPGWMCCDRWESWDEWSDEDRKVAIASTTSEATRLTRHPSVLGFMIASDHSPPDDVARDYVRALEARDFSGAILPSASGEGTSDLESGVKMTGPYDWVAPSYWYLDEDRGGAHGFNTESGPGPAIPELESLRAMLSDDELARLWQMPGAEQLHAGGGVFASVELFSRALAQRYGAPQSLADYVQKAQLMSYEAERAPFEAYARHKHAEATGFVHWLLNNAWPSLIWHLYGHDLALGAGYFGAKKANEPLHVQYSYDDGSIWVVNNGFAAHTNLSVVARVYMLDGTLASEDTAELDVGADASAQALTLPEPANASDTYFVALALHEQGKLVSENVYWLSTRAEVIDWEDTDFRHTGTAQFADFTALSELPRANLTVSSRSEPGVMRVTLENTGSALAFFVRLTLTAGRDGSAVWPVLWSDNYVSILPGQSRELAVRYESSLLGGAAPVVQVEGLNVPAQRTGD